MRRCPHIGQRERPQRKSILLTTSSQISTFQNFEKINICCLKISEYLINSNTEASSTVIIHAIVRNPLCRYCPKLAGSSHETKSVVTVAQIIWLKIWAILQYIFGHVVQVGLTQFCIGRLLHISSSQALSPEKRSVQVPVSHFRRWGCRRARKVVI